MMRIWLGITPMMFGGRPKSQIGEMCSAWAILPMNSLMNCLETNIKMGTEVEVWMMNLPFAQCGQEVVHPIPKAAGDPNSPSSSMLTASTASFHCTQCV